MDYQLLHQAVQSAAGLRLPGFKQAPRRACESMCQDLLSKPSPVGIKKLRKRDPELNSYSGTNCPPVGMIAADGKKRKIKAANTESLVRVAQPLSSPKAVPFKRWPAKVGYERRELET